MGSEMCIRDRHNDEDIFSEDLRIIRVIRGDRLDFRINRPVLHGMVKKLNRMKVNRLTLLETIQALDEFIRRDHIGRTK